MSLNLAIIGPGLVGSEFISQIAKSPVLNIVAITNSTRMLLASPSNSLSASTWKNDLSASSTKSDLAALVDYAAARQPCVIVDCTSSDAVASQYPAWLKKGLHVVTPNKKGFSGDLKLWRDVKEAANGKAIVFHESTVG